MRAAARVATREVAVATTPAAARAGGGGGGGGGNGEGVCEEGGMGGSDGAAEAEAEGHVGSQDTWGYGSEYAPVYIRLRPYAPWDHTLLDSHTPQTIRTPLDHTLLNDHTPQSIRPWTIRPSAHPPIRPWTIRRFAQGRGCQEVGHHALS